MSKDFEAERVTIFNIDQIRGRTHRWSVKGAYITVPTFFEISYILFTKSAINNSVSFFGVDHIVTDRRGRRYFKVTWRIGSRCSSLTVTIWSRSVLVVRVHLFLPLSTVQSVELEECNRCTCLDWFIINNGLLDQIFWWWNKTWSQDHRIILHVFLLHCQSELLCYIRLTVPLFLRWAVHLIITGVIVLVVILRLVVNYLLLSLSLLVFGFWIRVRFWALVGKRSDVRVLFWSKLNWIRRDFKHHSRGRCSPSSCIILQSRQILLIRLYNVHIGIIEWGIILLRQQRRVCSGWFSGVSTNLLLSLFAWELPGIVWSLTATSLLTALWTDHAPIIYLTIRSLLCLQIQWF